MSAWEALQRRRKDDAALFELPIANLVCLTANMNRDSSKRPEPFTLSDFLLFKDRSENSAAFSPEVAAVALALKHEGRCPPLVIGIWPQILASIKGDAKPPSIRALHSDDDSCWVLAPQWEGRHIRAGLVAVRGTLHGPITLRDLDRPLLTHRVIMPQHSGFAWMEARSLLLCPEN